MKEKISSFLNFTETDKFRNILKWIVVGSLFIYLFISISAYASWVPGSAWYFAFNTKTGLIFRILSSIIFLGACFLVYISYRKEINYKWLIVFLVMLIFILLCMLYTPTYFSVLYRTTKLYDFMAQYETSVSIGTLVKMYLSFAIDIFFAFSFLFVLPHIFKKQTWLLLFIFIPFLLIMIYSSAYSFVKEKDYYINFIKGDWHYNADTIGSIFGNKQQWGIFLAPTLPVCLISIYLVFKTKLPKLLKILFTCFSCVIFVLAAFCSLAAFCKTAILTNIIFIAFALIGLILWLFINKKKLLLPIIISCLIGLAVVGIIVFMGVDAWHQNGVGKTAFNIINSLFKESETSAASRIEIMLGTLQNFPATNIFFGFSKGILDCFVRTTVPYMNNGLHTGLAIYFGRTGIVGFTIYIILLCIVVLSIIKICRHNWLYGFIIIGAFISSFMLNLSELEILLVSSSGTVYIVNLIAVTLPMSESIKGGEYSYEK